MLYNFEIKLIDETILKGTINTKEYKRLKKSFGGSTQNFEFNYIDPKRNETWLFSKRNVVYLKIKERNEEK